jgi:iron complex transport system permease protein
MSVSISKSSFSSRVSSQSRGSSILWFVVLGAVLLVVLGVSLANGSYPISIPTLLAWLVGQADATAAQILSEVRAPRVFLALLVGASLGMV